MVSKNLSISVASLSDLLARCVAIARNIPGFPAFCAPEFQANYQRVRCHLEKLQKICQRYSSLSVKMCAAKIDPPYAEENLMTEALRLLNLAEQICRDVQVPFQKTNQSPSFPSGSGIISSEIKQPLCKEGGPTRTMGISQPANYVQTASQHTILICYVGEHESAHQLYSNLTGRESSSYCRDDIVGIVCVVKSSRSSFLQTKIPTVYISCQESLIRSHPTGPNDSDGLLFAQEPTLPYFKPVKEPVVANVECVNPKELCDCISWSVHLLAQQGACTGVSSKLPSMGFRNPQSQVKRVESDCVDGINYSICGFDPCRWWWSTLALFWIAFAEQPIDSTELISAVIAAGKDHFPTNSALFDGQLSGPSEVEIADILNKSLIISEAGRITPSSEEAKTVLLHIVSDPGGTDEGAIHELIAYTCLRCIERHEPTSIFRPWTIIESYLYHPSTSSRLLLYAASFWHIHFRIAESRSRRLSALLHRIIQSVLLRNRNNYCGFHPDSAQIINVGMWLCTFHDFTLLGRVYLEMGADVTAGLPDTCPLHIAASKPSLGVLELILEKQSELDVVDRESMTPLQVAAFHGHVVAVKMLLAAGAGVNKTFTMSRETALHIAVRSGQEKIVALLLEQGAEVNARNIRSESPLDIALRKGIYAIAKMLIDEGAIRLSCPTIEMTTTEAMYAFQGLSLAEQGTSLELGNPQYVVQRPTRLNVHLNYRSGGHDLFRNWHHGT